MKKRMIKVVSMLLAASMVMTSAAGCGNSEETGSSTADTKAAETTDKGNEDTETAAGEEEADDEEMAEITVALMAMSPKDDSAVADVIAAVNEITESEINVHVDLKWYDPNTYATQVPMMIQANEKLDLIQYTPVPGAGFTSFHGQNQLLDISALLEEHAPETVALMGDLLDATSTSEGTFGIATYRLLASDEYIFMRKDILDELGLTEKAENLSSWTEFEEILAAVKERGDITPISNNDAQGTVLTPQPCFNGNDLFAEDSMYDQLGDSYQMIACGEDGKIECYYFAEDYKTMIDRAADWYSKDYVYKDAATSQDVGQTLLKNGVTFSAVGISEFGVEETYQSSTGYAMVCPKITDGIIETGSCHKFGYGVPVTATEEEAAVKFINELYTNEKLANIMAWGVEGRDWVEKDGVACYPDGVSADTVLYHESDFLYGNQFNVLPWEGSDADLRDQQKKIMDEAKTSEFMGFIVDSSGIENEVTACFNVTKEYKAGLASGSVNVAELYPEFCQKLKDAGIEKVIETYQQQLDDWLAAK